MLQKVDDVEVFFDNSHLLYLNRKRHETQNKNQKR